MIADKLIPSFYVIDVEGEAANLEFILGKRFKIDRVTFGSWNFPTDAEALVAGEEAIDLFLENPLLKFTDTKLEKQYNPDFYPTLDPIKVSDKMREEEELLEETILSKSPREDTITTVLTHRFDDLGDYISFKMKIENEKFGIQMKVGADPQEYLLHKSIEKQEQINSQYGRYGHHQEFQVH